MSFVIILYAKSIRFSELRYGHAVRAFNYFNGDYNWILQNSFGSRYTFNPYKLNVRTYEHVIVLIVCSSYLSILSALVIDWSIAYN